MPRRKHSLPWIGKFLISLSALLVVITFTHSARAQEPIVLVNPPALLEEATGTALVAWELRLQSIQAELPSESMPGARDGALALTQEFGARAVIWITSNDDGPALWVYDAEDDRVVVRRLSVAPPFDEASAAAVALSIKTLLMHSRTAPEEERFGATESRSIPMPVPEQWIFEAQGGMRHSLADDDSLEARVLLGLTRALGRLELGASLALGPGRTIAESSFQGHYSDVAFGAHLRHPIRWRNWTLSPELGAALHATKISGTLTSDNRAVAVRRFNPSIAAGAFLLREFPRIRAGIGARSNLFTRTQRYLVAGAPVLDLPTVDLEVGAYVAVPFR
jgi:hypothetical protein